jgi:hypothetical protein
MLALRFSGFQLYGLDRISGLLESLFEGAAKSLESISKKAEPRPKTLTGYRTSSLTLGMHSAR